MIFPIGSDKDIIFSRFRHNVSKNGMPSKIKKEDNLWDYKKISRMVDKNPLAVIYFSDVLILVR
jgi:hypothetical protein